MEVGYIGLGSMGGGIARRLLLSRKLHVFDINAKLMTEFEMLGAKPAGSAAELALNCDVVMICVPRSANVRQAIFGPAGVAEGISPKKIVVDQTSGNPSETREMASELAKLGVSMVDAPVSGGPRGAAAGTLAVMVGGSEEDCAVLKPIFDDISPNHVYCGDVGSGQVLKLINNTISTCNRFAMLEAVSLGLKNGLKLSTMADVLNASGARSRSSEVLLRELVAGKTGSTMALSLMLKDLNLAGQLAIDSGAPLTFGQLARGILQMASNQLGPSANLDEIANVVAKQAGVSFKQ